MSFRFHLLVPILVLYVIWKKWRVIEGAVLVGAALAALSISLVGIDGSILYAKSAAATTEVRQGYPVNIYGCIQATLGSRHSFAAGLIACACGVVALWYASRQKPSIETAILVVPLASYYLMMHDLVMLLIPIAVMLRRSFASVLQFVVTILGFSPLSCLSGAPAALILFWPNRDSSAKKQT